jgi:hypothetical protein
MGGKPRKIKNVESGFDPAAHERQACCAGAFYDHLKQIIPVRAVKSFSRELQS